MFGPERWSALFRAALTGMTTKNIPTGSRKVKELNRSRRSGRMWVENRERIPDWFVGLIQFFRRERNDRQEHGVSSRSCTCHLFEGTYRQKVMDYWNCWNSGGISTNELFSGTSGRRGISNRWRNVNVEIPITNDHAVGKRRTGYYWFSVKMAEERTSRICGSSSRTSAEIWA